MSKKKRVPDNQLTLIDMEPTEDEDIATAMTLCPDCLNNEECDGSPFYRGDDRKLRCDMKEKKPRVKRIASLEERVTRLEGEVTLVRGQLEREEDPYEEDD